VKDGNFAELLILSREINAWKLSEEARSASLQLGSRRFESGRRVFPHPAWEKTLVLQIPLHHLTVYALQMAVCDVPLEAALLGYAYQTLSGAGSAALKLIRIGQHGVQRVLTAALADIGTVVSRSMAVERADAGWFNPGERKALYLMKILRIGIGGPVGSGKTMLTWRLCQWLRAEYSLGVITNDIYTREDAEFLVRNEALPADRVLGVETGGCPHTAIRDDTSMNLAAVAELEAIICPPRFRRSWWRRSFMSSTWRREIKSRARAAPRSGTAIFC
jgi:hypothetical protein